MIKTREDLSQSRLKEVLSYCPDTGVFTWIKPKPQKCYMVGRVAGCVSHQGYVLIRVGGVLRQAHRLAWLYVYGAWPEDEVDHANGNRADNRISNLRGCSRSENTQNIATPRNNTTGRLGVTWNVERNKYIAQIAINRVHKSLGGFDDPDEAHKAYLAAKSQLHTFQPTPRISNDQLT
jgi:hypothetical protein